MAEGKWEGSSYSIYSVQISKRCPLGGESAKWALPKEPLWAGH